MRIMIIGCAGSGKTTLASQLSKRYQIPVIYLDQHYWKENWVASTKDEWNETIESLVHSSKDWIMDGNYTSSIEQRIAYVDEIIFLDFSRLACLCGVIKRRIQHHNKVRFEMPKGCYEKIDYEFLSWIWNFNKRQRPKLLQAIKKATQAKTTILSSRKEVKQYLQTKESKNQ